MWVGVAIGAGGNGGRKDWDGSEEIEMGVDSLCIRRMSWTSSKRKSLERNLSRGKSHSISGRWKRSWRVEGIHEKSVGGGDMYESAVGGWINGRDLRLVVV